MYRRSMFPSSPDFVPANLRLYHVSTLGFAPYNFFRYDVYGKSVAASRALAPVREELLASGNSWHFCSCFRKQRGEKGRGLQVSEGGNGELLAETTGSFAPALRKQRGEGLRGLLACQGLEDPTTRTSAGGSRGEKGGEDYWYRTRSSVNYWQASNSWHFCSKQFVGLLIYHRQSSA